MIHCLINRLNIIDSMAMLKQFLDTWSHILKICPLQNVRWKGIYVNVRSDIMPTH